MKNRLFAVMVFISIVFLTTVSVWAAPPSPPSPPGDFGKEPVDETITKDQPATKVTASKNLQTAAKQKVTIITSSITKSLSPRSSASKRTLPGKPGSPASAPTSYNLEYEGLKTGLSAGDEGSSFGVWTNLALVNSKDNKKNQKSSSDLTTIIAGADKTFGGRIVCGAVVVLETVDETTAFNSGSMDSDGFTLAPYLAAVVTDNILVDVSGGYSWVSIDQARNLKSAPITSATDANRYFVAANANIYHSIGSFFLTGTLGYMYAEEEQDDFVESNGKKVEGETSDLGQLSIGGEVSWLLENIEPYVNAAYEYNTTYTENTGTDDEYDKSGIRAKAGMRFSFGQNILCDAQAGGVLAKDDYNEFFVSMNLRYEF